ncbi:hypothetical protein Shyhy01_25440 [Streptomyces hygroscopicus subsp. hygroscopicus]|nr:hypothetical protein Shyhy01_25440 [Streptomyces hygroscopicus subsp. hygroscopicus]
MHNTAVWSREPPLIRPRPSLPLRLARASRVAAYLLVRDGVGVKKPVRAARRSESDP